MQLDWKANPYMLTAMGREIMQAIAAECTADLDLPLGKYVGHGLRPWHGSPRCYDLVLEFEKAVVACWIDAGTKISNVSTYRQKLQPSATPDF